MKKLLLIFFVLISSLSFSQETTIKILSKPTYLDTLFLKKYSVYMMNRNDSIYFSKPIVGLSSNASTLQTKDTTYIMNRANQHGTQQGTSVLVTDAVTGATNISGYVSFASALANNEQGTGRISPDQVISYVTTPLSTSINVASGFGYINYSGINKRIAWGSTSFSFIGRAESGYYVYVGIDSVLRLSNTAPNIEQNIYLGRVYWSGQFLAGITQSSRTIKEFPTYLNDNFLKLGAFIYDNGCLTNYMPSNHMKITSSSGNVIRGNFKYAMSQVTSDDYAVKFFGAAQSAGNHWIQFYPMYTYWKGTIPTLLYSDPTKPDSVTVGSSITFTHNSKIATSTTNLLSILDSNSVIWLNSDTKVVEDRIDSITWNGSITRIAMHFAYAGSSATGLSSYSNMYPRVPSGKWAKHLICRDMIGNMFFIPSTSVFNTQGDAFNGAAPSVPSYLSDLTMQISTIVVQANDTTLVGKITDIRPLPFTYAKISNAVGGAGGVTVHAQLLNLTSDDHPQYLLTDGSRNLLGIQSYNTHPTFTQPTNLIDKKYVDDNFSPILTIDNGLTRSINTVNLGGTLSQATNIATAGNKLSTTGSDSVIFNNPVNVKNYLLVGANNGSNSGNNGSINIVASPNDGGAVNAYGVDGGGGDWVSINLRRSSGTFNAMTDIAPYGGMGNLNFQGFIGSLWRNGAVIKTGCANGWVAGSNYGTTMEIQTTNINQTTPTTKIYIDGNGLIGIGSGVTRDSILNVLQGVHIYGGLNVRQKTNMTNIATYGGNYHTLYGTYSLTDKKYVDSIASLSGVTPVSNILYWNSSLSAYTLYPSTTVLHGVWYRDGSDPTAIDSVTAYNGRLKATSIQSSATTLTGVFGQSTTNYGVQGQSTGNAGVYGVSTNSYGVYGTSTNGYGIYGYSASGYGIFGESSSSVGVYGSSTSSAGLSGSSTSSYGTIGSSSSGIGVYGKSTTGIGGVFNIDGGTQNIFEGRVAGVALNNIDYRGVLNYIGNRHSYYSTYSLTDKSYVDSTDALHVSGTGISGQVSYWSGTGSQSGDVNFLFDATNKNLALGGTANEPTGASTLNNTVLTLSGKTLTSKSSNGLLVLNNNRTTPAANDTLGVIWFSAQNNGTSPTFAKRTCAGIYGFTSGSGGANGFGGALNFYTKADNVASLTTNMQLLSGGGATITSSNINYPALTVNYSGSTYANNSAVTANYNGTGSTDYGLIAKNQSSGTGGAAIIAQSVQGNYGIVVSDAGMLSGTQTYDMIYLYKNPSSGGQNNNGNWINIQSSPTGGGTVSGSAIKYNTANGVVLNMNPEVADGASAIAYLLNTNVNLVTTGAKLLSIQNFSSEKFSIDKDGSMTNAGKIIWSASASSNAITAGTGITAAMCVVTVVKVNGNGAPVTITANPSIAAGTDNQVIVIEGTDNTNTVTINNGNGVSLDNTVSFTIKKRGTLMLKYNATESVWEEISRSANQ